LQDECAAKANADYIITWNTKDFVHSIISAITPEAFLDILKSERVRISGKIKGSLSLSSPFHITGIKYMDIEGLTAKAGLRLECIDKYNGQVFSPKIEIGYGVFMNYNCHIGAIDHIHIGNNVLMGSNVLITDHSHGHNVADEMDTPPVMRELYSKGPVIIEDNVWIGENVCILPKVHIGKGCIIAAGSIITHDVPEYTIVGGNPGRIIRKLKQ